MSPEQYERLLEDVRDLRRALGLPHGALDMTPRAAFRECIDCAQALLAERDTALRQRDEARATERAAVVTWLREMSFAGSPDLLLLLADRIERGDHDDAAPGVARPPEAEA